MALSLLTAGLSLAPAAAATFETNSPAPRPTTQRELYNLGTARLREGKLDEAQDLLRAAAAGDNEAIVPSAVYNLGHARYELGDRELVRTLTSPQLNDIPRRAQRNAQAALQSAQAALAGGDVDDLVAAYRRGAGARKELREAAKAVESALAQFKTVLAHWQRASASFHSVNELEPQDTNSARNAEIVDRRIAELIDFLKKQKLAMMSGGGTGQELKGVMKQIRDKLPADRKGDLPGELEENDSDGDEEGRGGGGSVPGDRRGREPITQEQAAQLLRGVQLDSQRTLPVANPRGVRQVKRPGGDW